MATVLRRVQQLLTILKEDISESQRVFAEHATLAQQLSDEARAMETRIMNESEMVQQMVPGLGNVSGTLANTQRQSMVTSGEGGLC